MSIHDTDLSVTGYVMGSVLVLGLIPFVGLFVLAAAMYPLSATVVLAMVAFLYGLHRWRVPSTDVEMDGGSDWHVRR